MPSGKLGSSLPWLLPPGALLALTPLARAGLPNSPVVIDAKTGSSGSGKEPGEGTHHPTRAQDFRAYGLFKHRHRPEIAQELGRWLPRTGDANRHSQEGTNGLRIAFTPHSAPMCGAYSPLPTPS